MNMSPSLVFALFKLLLLVRHDLAVHSNREPAAPDHGRHANDLRADGFHDARGH